MADDVRATDEDGVEDEDIGSISEPFDPNTIRVRPWTPTIDLLLTRIAEGELDLAPDFQRKGGIWSPRNMSRLIESILTRIPLPAFYFDAKDEDRLVVIDGIQRLTVLKQFCLDKELRLTDLEFLGGDVASGRPGLDGMGFDDLPRALQRRILETPVTVHVIERGTPEAAKLNIFKRINTGGAPLRAQEIRHAMNPGPARRFLAELAEGEPFRRATDYAVSDKRMDDREFVARFMAFALHPPETYDKRGDFDAFINQGMRDLNAMTELQRRALARRFERSMNAAYALFGDDAFRKRYAPADRRKPVNKALFESWAIALDALTDQQLERLSARQSEVQSAFIELMNEPDFHSAITNSTGDPKKVRRRFSAIAGLVGGFL